MKSLKAAEPSGTFPEVSVIIPAMNESSRIASVIREARAVHHNTEVIVLANGCSDNTAEVAKAAGAITLCFPEPLGHDVGRSIGAREACGNILLFIDGDMVIHARDLRPYVRAVAGGIDVALNDYTGPIHRKPVHRVILAKYALNAMLGRRDLKGASMTAVPHAISRKALEVIRSEMLSVPPKAQAAAIEAGLTVKAVHKVEVGKLNPRRVRGYDPLEALVLGDHLEALSWVITQRGLRGGFQDEEDRRGRIEVKL
ncbi:glycosyltransferase family 2 protein [Paenibacillus lemnae]|uniref:Glycosyltransferase n=1 Tax=Paenibacillus lemnae TaxID=1330551 RepID=A0A848M2L0_PAELE|nr:glycosyltransferase [Paenibacillus lemnae]NMO95228.1 glycosyltransferase [Paenibacillus lemnae]